METCTLALQSSKPPGRERIGKFDRHAAKYLEEGSVCADRIVKVYRAQLQGKEREILDEPKHIYTGLLKCRRSRLSRVIKLPRKQRGPF